LLLLLGAAPLDPIGAPLPLYLEEADVALALSELEPALQACGAQGERTESVQFSISAEGVVTGLKWEAPDGTDIACWSTAIGAHRFPEHSDEPVDVKTIIYVREGRTFVSPQPVMLPRPVGPLMLFVLPGDDSPGRLNDAYHGPGKQ
jgi:hypothetical protein